MDNTDQQEEADIQQPTELQSEDQTDESSDDTGAVGELPEEASERTRNEFEKLKAHNRQLKEQVDSLKSRTTPRPNLVDELYPQVQPQQNVHNLSAEQVSIASSANLVDENGYVDIAALNATFAQLNKQANDARQEAQAARQQVERYEHTQEARQVYKEYPQLDPENDDFDESFANLVKRNMIGQMYESGKSSYLKAAKEIGSLLKTDPKKAQSEEEKQANLQKRDLASQSVNTAKRQSSNSTLEELRTKSVNGDMDAISQRLKASGY